MPADPDVSELAGLLTGHRADILLSLLGGVPLTPTEIARRTGISASLASSHLSKLLEGGLVAVRCDGRRRYFELARPEVAQLLEHMLAVAPPRPVANGLRAHTKAAALARARTCYDHLAGRLGVAVIDAMTHAGLVVASPGAYDLTPAGGDWFMGLGVDTDPLRRARRAFASRCLDWTERRPHLAGAVGAALATTFLDRAWIVRIPQTRAVRVTEEGNRALREHLDLDVDD